MRNVIAILISLMAAALVCCAWISHRSDREIAPRVTNFLVSLLGPVVGNLIIIVAHTETFSLVGRHLYAAGIDVVMYCLLDFTLQYCGLTWKKWAHRVLVACLAVDVVQFLCNPLFGHAFSSDMMMVDGAPYFNVQSHWGRTIHLALIYVIMIAILAILLFKIVRSGRIYSEKYSIMFALLMFTGVWEMFYLFSRTPVKRSVLAYGVLGILAFYFSLYYRPRRLLDQMLADLASGMTDGLFFFDESGKCLWADENGETLVGVTNGDYARCPGRLDEMFPGLELESGNSEWQCSRTLGEQYYSLAKHSVYDANKRMIGSVLSLRDDTERERALERERYIANHDPLTGLYTKQRLYELIRERIDSDPDTAYCVAYVDISNFKLVNDVYGQEFGDHVLQTIGRHISENMPEGALCGRLGGDTFGLCFPENEFDAAQAETLMSEFIIENEMVTRRIMVHQGVYQVTDRGIDVSVMFDRAHIAMETIKRDYKKHVVLYDDAMRRQALRNQEITTRLQGALTNGEICPYLQAIVDAEGKVIGAEALVRWLRPNRGMTPPSEFVPVLEENGAIADVDRHMWRCACGILKRWERMGRDDLFISINVSPKDFYFMNVPEELMAIVGEYGVSPSRLRVEITESVMMDDRADRFETLRILRNAGFIVEMDDFGSGYSSLNVLKDMPVDIVKIDMLFLRDSEDQSRMTVVLRNMINMMTELGLVPLTEGIETETQHQMLEQMGCKLFQGYLFARPMPAEQFEQSYLDA